MKKQYYLNDIPFVDSKFKEYFNRRFVEFEDRDSTIFFKRLCIDIIKFDELIHNLYGDYENKNLSMAEVISQNIGYEAKELIENLL
jgi:hypothetical protein